MGQAEGKQTIGFLLERGRLEQIFGSGLAADSLVLLDRATRRRATAQAAADGEDWEGAFANAYDVYRMAAEALLLRQGLRATGGDGPHVAVEDAVAGQFGQVIDAFSKVLFERFRQGRHASHDPNRPDTTDADARWALGLAARALEGARSLVESGELGVYR